MLGATTLSAATPARAAQLQVCFSPPLPGGCDPLTTVVQAIDGAQHTVRVQMYALTSREITSALVNAKRRGVDVRVIVDRAQLDGNLEPVPGAFTATVNRHGFHGR